MAAAKLNLIPKAAASFKQAKSDKQKVEIVAVEFVLKGALLSRDFCTVKWIVCG